MQTVTKPARLEQNLERFVSSADNVVKPWLISQGSDLPFILIFFGVLGGAPEFGF